MIDICVRKAGDVWFGVACDANEVYASTFAFGEKKALRGLLGSIPYGVSFQKSNESSPFADRVLAVIKDIYEGKDASPSFSLASRHLPDYTRRVLETVYMIPTGYISTYGLVSKAVGGGSRAVGNVMARNPFPPIVPCHRVVRSDFSLGGYGGGLGLKLQMLEREKRDYDFEKEISSKGERLRLFPVEFALRTGNK